MAYTGISLQRISLGALIIALGLLVDDAMIAVEMMVARLEVGDPLEKAATHVYTSTAFPMLTGTLVTVAGFIPIGLNSSNAGEFTFTLFVVIAVSLIVSWIVAVLFTPLLGVAILPAKIKGHHQEKGRVGRLFSRVLLVCMRHRWITIGLTVAAFLLAVFGMKFVQQQFFPSSDRSELVIDWNLPHNASIADTNAQIARFEREQLQGNDGVEHWSTYVGTGAPRFVLSFDLQTANTWFGQMVVVTKGGIAARDRLKDQFETYLKKTFPGTDTFVKLLEVGPPVGRPVQYRVSGPDIHKVKALSQELAGIVRSNPHLGNVVFDWMEPARVVKVDVLQDKARQLGVSSEDIATTLNSVLDGTSITQVRDSIYLVNVVGRATAPERASIDTLRDLQLVGLGGQSVPLGAVATFRYEIEQPTIWRRSRIPTITLKASVIGNAQPKTVVDQLAPKVSEFAKDTARGIFDSDRRCRRGERQEPGSDHGRGSADAVHHGHDPDGSIAELPSVVPGVRRRATRGDRCRHGFAAERSTSWLRCHSGRACPDWHPDPQLGDPDCADRGSEEGRPAGLGSGGGSHRASHAADIADRSRRNLWASFRSRVRFSGARWPTR